MNEIKQFCKENPKFVLSFIGVFIVFLVCSWVLYDAERNERIYHDTDNTVTEMEERVDTVADGLDRMQERVAESEKAVSGIAESVKDSRRKAESITESISRTEARLDDAIQRSGRLANELTDLEAKHR